MRRRRARASGGTPHRGAARAGTVPGETAGGCTPAAVSPAYSPSSRPASGAVRPRDAATLAPVLPTLGEATFDIWLNDRAHWRNVPAAVWKYRLGGYQVLKKWLPYRERSVLKRPLRPQEVQHFTDTTRRIAAILLLTT